MERHLTLHTNCRGNCLEPEVGIDKSCDTLIELNLLTNKTTVEFESHLGYN